ncbi:MAG TPA: D-aminoacyl-tRNA deacylase [Oligoflexia bacterium]|nr:D-aminoacyl-tRNA deacylase [Oligoflexia bacterium]
MKVIIQRVSEASVSVTGQTAGCIGAGLMLLAGIAADDTREKLRPMAEKIANMRIFPDESGRFHYSLLDTKGGVLVVPQFTLFADTSKGRRPEFFGAMKPPLAEELFAAFCWEFSLLGISPVEKGVFGAEMHVALVNHGPVTIIVEN